MDEPIYIHYGHSKFYPAMPTDLRNNFMNKPESALWASREDCDSNWRIWCENENFKDEDYFKRYFRFKLRNPDRVYELRNMADYIKLPKKPNLFNFPKYLIDFYEVKRQGWDAIELFLYGSEDKFDFDLHMNIYGWDCNSIVILNSAAVMPL